MARLEAGDVDYLLTVDVFNEGVDIPSINQIIMLRQTQSATVFVQQLGRGATKTSSEGLCGRPGLHRELSEQLSDPGRLFGDESLHKESLNQRLAAAEESGVLPGLASIRFDRVSQRRVLRSIADARLDSVPNLKQAIMRLRSRLGRLPDLADFLPAESADPVLLATKRRSYPDLVEQVLRTPMGLTDQQHGWLKQLSHEVLPAARGHEFEALAGLLRRPRTDRVGTGRAVHRRDLPVDDQTVASVSDSFTLATHSRTVQDRYPERVAEQVGGQVRLTHAFMAGYQQNPAFGRAVDDIVMTGRQLVARRYAAAHPFAPGYQYSRNEVTRLLGWPRSFASTIYGYKIYRGVCPIFITLHKPANVPESLQYQDRLLDPQTVEWFTRSRRTLTSKDVAPIVANQVRVEVFVRRDDAEGPAHYYLGSATSAEAREDSMPEGGARAPVVRIRLHLAEPIGSGLFDYFHPHPFQLSPAGCRPPRCEWPTPTTLRYCHFIMSQQWTARPLYEVKAGLFRGGLSHPYRIRLLELLADGEEHTVTELLENIELEPSHASQHLAVLRRHRLVDSERRGGSHVYYRLVSPQGGRAAGGRPLAAVRTDHRRRRSGRGPGRAPGSAGPMSVAQRVRSLLPSLDDYRNLRHTWRSDLVAGLTVGIVALPLALGFGGVSSGVSAEAGLITAIVAGILAAIFGGSNVQISGPTGAMVVVLLPIVAQHGVGAVATVSVLAGLIVIVAGVLRLGRAVSFIRGR